MSEVADDVSAAFREAMRCMASTVSIVTAGDRQRGHGMTATAITSVSFDPPSLLVCINRATFLHELLSSTDTFCVNVLGRDQSDISRAFSGAVAPEARFALGDWSQTAEGLKYLRTAPAAIFCRKAMTTAFGTHTIFIGTVQGVHVEATGEPLLYRNATYCASSPLMS